MKIKTLTSMNRDGIAIQNGSEIDVPEGDALSLCVNGLAQPVDFEIKDGAIVEPAKKKSAKAE